MSRSVNIAFFVALLASALVLGPALAHVFKLPNKIGLPRDEYFIAKKVYRGWNQLGWLLLVQVAVLAAQVVFWLFTYPTNVATVNWTLSPDSWETLRRQWGYSHAAGAGLQLVAFSLLVLAALGRVSTTIPTGLR